MKGWCGGWSIGMAGLAGTATSFGWTGMTGTGTDTGWLSLYPSVWTHSCFGICLLTLTGVFLWTLWQTSFGTS